MVDVIYSDNQLSVLGGPSSVNVELDLGAAGQRGSQIFTGQGKPTSDDVELPALEINDLYINLNPSDNEYLFLYQYNNVNGVLTWSRVLRLVPNTALLNPTVTFVNGQAVTVILGQTLPGLFFPLGEFFSLEELGVLEAEDFNIQHNLIGDAPTASTVNVDAIITEYAGFPLGASYLRITMTAAEYDMVGNSWSPVTGDRLVHFLATIGGRVEETA